MRVATFSLKPGVLDLSDSLNIDVEKIIKIEISSNASNICFKSFRVQYKFRVVDLVDDLLYPAVISSLDLGTCITCTPIIEITNKMIMILQNLENSLCCPMNYEKGIQAYYQIVLRAMSKITHASENYTKSKRYLKHYHLNETCHVCQTNSYCDPITLRCKCLSGFIQNDSECIQADEWLSMCKCAQCPSSSYCSVMVSIRLNGLTVIVFCHKS